MKWLLEDMITGLCNLVPLETHLYIVKLGFIILGFTGVFFSYFCSKHRFTVQVRTVSCRWFQGVPTIYVLSNNKKNVTIFPLKIVKFYSSKSSNI